MVYDTPVPIDFFNNKRTKAQRRYSAFDRELLVAYLSVLYSKPFLEDHKVNLYVDQKP